MFLSWLIDVTRDVLADLGLFERSSSYPGCLSNADLDEVLR